MRRREAFVRDRDSKLDTSNKIRLRFRHDLPEFSTGIGLGLESGAPVDSGPEWPEEMQKLFGFSTTGTDTDLTSASDEGSESPKVPCVPKTNLHLKAMNDIVGAIKDKSIPLDEFGIPKVGCWCQKPSFCRICDNRKGNWVCRRPIQRDPIFTQYQTSITRDKFPEYAAPNKTQMKGSNMSNEKKGSYGRKSFY